MSDFASEREPFAVWQLQLESEHFTNVRLAHRIDVTAAFRQICDARLIVSALAVPDGVEANIPSFFGSAVAHR